ncbi:MAG: Mur ligase domain-containing protein [Puniceicoccales bacterium]|jgi:UDP-N-acetylmuramate: L-alanyl-gamma-D-glutamyl-meso-diaminopimelate ligase|nr:Mur ligase domain-containing protein [Puniceicoccales bacterium]
MKIYFIGIGGTAMGNVAVLLKKLGHDICGSDLTLYQPMAGLLNEHKIDIYDSFSAARLEAINPTAVIVGNAIARGNEEVEWLLATKKIPYYSLPEFIHREIMKKRQSIVLTGTHGKTTTTALTTFLLKNNGLNPGHMIGGVPIDFSYGSALGNENDPFVIEGDEYDSAFFDKRSKFIHYAPDILVIGNLEFDHGDIFRDLEDIKRSFNHLLKIIPSNGYVIANGDDLNIRSMFPLAWINPIFVGENDDNDYLLKHFSTSENFTSFDIIEKISGKKIHIISGLFGKYNARNALMAIIASGIALSGNPLDVDVSCLQRFKGIKKRQEVLLSNANLMVIDDFAHHPTAIKATLECLRQKYPGRRLIACFEPRSNTACTNAFQNEFVDAFAGADAVFIANAFKTRETTLDTPKLAENLVKIGIDAKASSSEEILYALEKMKFKEATTLAFLSNGSFGNIAKKFVKNFTQHN